MFRSATMKLRKRRSSSYPSGGEYAAGIWVRHASGARRSGPLAQRFAAPVMAYESLSTPAGGRLPVYRLHVKMSSLPALWPTQ
jgi:hypothetical protein